MRGFSHILQTRLGVIAAISIAVLFVVAVSQIRGPQTPRTITASATSATSSEVTAGADWQQEMILLGLATSSDPSATSTNDSLTMIGPVVMAQIAGQYAGMQAAGTYTPAGGVAAAQDIAQNVNAALSYKTYAATDFKTDPDPSYARMLTYRSDMQEAIKPLLDNTEAEYAIYGLYMESGDASYLRKLQAAADNYTKAAENALSVTVPRDTVQNHVDLVNAMSEFAAALNALATHANDAIASVAILRAYNAAEGDVVAAFNKIATYERLKTQ